MSTDRDALGRFVKGHKAGHRWQPGESGNPRGTPKTKQRLEVERRLLEALLGADEPGALTELATLIWRSARRGESWALSLLVSKLAPQSLSLKVSREEESHDDKLDWSKLSAEEFEVVGKLLAKAAGELEDDGRRALVGGVHEASVESD
jgi:hypothetical protein